MKERNKERKKQMVYIFFKCSLWEKDLQRFFLEKTFFFSSTVRNKLIFFQSIKKEIKKERRQKVV